MCTWETPVIWKSYKLYKWDLNITEVSSLSFLKGCIKEMVGADIYKLYYGQMSHVSSHKEVNAKVKSRLGTTGFIHKASSAWV